VNENSVNAKLVSVSNVSVKLSSANNANERRLVNEND
jgi:hypothetical protein